MNTPSSLISWPFQKCCRKRIAMLNAKRYTWLVLNAFVRWFKCNVRGNKSYKWCCHKIQIWFNFHIGCVQLNHEAGKYNSASADTHCTFWHWHLCRFHLFHQQDNVRYEDDRGVRRPNHRSRTYGTWCCLPTDTAPVQGLETCGNGSRCRRTRI